MDDLLFMAEVEHVEQLLHLARIEGVSVIPIIAINRLCFEITFAVMLILNDVFKLGHALFQLGYPVILRSRRSLDLLGTIKRRPLLQITQIPDVDWVRDESAARQCEIFDLLVGRHGGMVRLDPHLAFPFLVGSAVAADEFF
jgi:hypothetical protein